MSSLKSQLASLAALLVALVPSAPGAASGARVKYRITDLGPGVALAVNGLGQVVGQNNTGGYLYDRGVFTDLGSLGGGSTRPEAISDAGVVVGDSFTAAGDQRAFVYRDGVMTDLLGVSSIAFGVNTAGDVVGDALFSSTRHAFLYSGGAVTALSSSYCCSRAHGINDRGQVVGYDSPPGTTSQQGVIWTAGVPQFMGKLRPSDEVSEAFAINEAGAAVGASTTINVSTHAFLYRDGSLVDISPAGTTFASSLGINEAGDAVGFYFDGTTNRAFLFRGGVSVDLNSLVIGARGWLLSGAAAINDAGAIVGWGDRNGVQHGFLATPE